MAVDIYAFFHMDGNMKRYFYVGRSQDLKRRMREHKYRKATGHEDKYEFIRQLEAADTAWTSEIIETVPDEAYYPDAERWHVIRLTREGHILMNMRHGSIEHRKQLTEQVLAPHIRSAADVRADRERKAKFHDSRALRRRIRRKWITQLKKEGIPDVVADTTLPLVIKRKLLAQMEAAGDTFAPGWGLKDFICWVRKPLKAFRELRELRESINAPKTDS